MRGARNRTSSGCSAPPAGAPTVSRGAAVFPSVTRAALPADRRDATTCQRRRGFFPLPSAGADAGLPLARTGGRSARRPLPATNGGRRTRTSPASHARRRGSSPRSSQPVSRSPARTGPADEWLQVALALSIGIFSERLPRSPGIREKARLSQPIDQGGPWPVRQPRISSSSSAETRVHRIPDAPGVTHGRRGRPESHLMTQLAMPSGAADRGNERRGRSTCPTKIFDTQRIPNLQPLVGRSGADAVNGSRSGLLAGRGWPRRSGCSTAESPVSTTASDGRTPASSCRSR